MSLFSAAPTIFFLRRDGFEMYSGDGSAPIPFPYPPEAVQNLEVLDRGVLENALQAFFTQQPLTNTRFLFLISEDLLFHKAFVEADQQKQKDMEKQFLDEVPIDPKYLIHGRYVDKDQFHCYAVNKQFYLVLRSLFLSMKDDKGKSKNMSVVSVLPTFLFGQIEDSQSVFGQQAGLTADGLTSALASFSKFSKYNLLIQEPKINKPIAKLEMESTSKKSNVVAIVAFVIFFIVVLGGVGFMLKKQADDTRDASLRAQNVRDKQAQQAAQDAAAADAAAKAAQAPPQTAPIASPSAK